MSFRPRTSTKPIHELVNDYYARRPNFADLAGSDSDSEGSESEPDIKSEIRKEDEEKGIERSADAIEFEVALRELRDGFGVRRAKKYRRKDRERKEGAKMPVHPSEGNAGGNITDQVNKESSDSTASTHDHHKEETGASSAGGKLSAAMAHRANPGPVMTENIGKPESKEELKKRAEELNQ
ncbi:hypothetical protein K432DRAFT_378293 [Lepidopterella palustris CBS 459.81]|uniref:Uncharacterized protein n=1 Tax=Lepidopterella palustris CBS 459.81 TaxID=1314670 RepID=A0A8E2EJ56_9PEZI|nr:hypothetical protein K432DRAFT_378293 [Lepidopterella palustris CBS 459.81]